MPIRHILVSAMGFSGTSHKGFMVNTRSNDAKGSPAMGGRLVVIGLGLIGSSFARAVRERGLFAQVTGIDRHAEVGRRAAALGHVDDWSASIADIGSHLQSTDLILIAVPTMSVRAVLAELKTHVREAVTVTDAASVKGSVVRDAQSVYGHCPAQFVPGHPIAGSEKSGVEAADSGLFDRHRVILTPEPETSKDHLARVGQLWEALGAEVVIMGVGEHDEILGATSHLPHAIAFSLVDTLAHDSQNENIFRYAAGGFRDFTRIASSDATMWRDIMLANGDDVIHAIDLFNANLAGLKKAIANRDGEALEAIFTRAKRARDHFTAMLDKDSGQGPERSE